MWMNIKLFLVDLYVNLRFAEKILSSSMNFFGSASPINQTTNRIKMYH